MLVYLSNFNYGILLLPGIMLILRIWWGELQLNIRKVLLLFCTHWKLLSVKTQQRCSS